MMRDYNIKITTYDYRDGFKVDVIENIEKEVIEAWLYHKDCGIKELMFGVPKHQESTGLSITLDGFLDMVEANLESQNYIDNYEDEYMS